MAVPSLASLSRCRVSLTPRPTSGGCFPSCTCILSFPRRPEYLSEPGAPLARSRRGNGAGPAVWWVEMLQAFSSSPSLPHPLHPGPRQGRPVRGALQTPRGSSRMSPDSAWAWVREGLCPGLWKLLWPKESSGLDSAWRCDLGKISKQVQPLSPSAKWIETSTSQDGCGTQTGRCNGRFLGLGGHLRTGVGIKSKSELGFELISLMAQRLGPALPSGQQSWSQRIPS